MQQTSRQFKQNASAALKDENLAQAMAFAKDGFIGKRHTIVSGIPEWQAMRSHAQQLKNHVLDHLDDYLQRYEAAVQANGGQVHWAKDSQEACAIIAGLCMKDNAHSVAKGKSMIGEEVDLNEALEKAGMEVVETDLGEYIIQLAGEMPSHIIAPAIHKTREQVSALFHEHHRQYGLNEKLDDRRALVNEARTVLREKFLNADVGITGANFLLADTGQHVLITNEGNGDLSSNLPRRQIVITSIEKVLPGPEDAALFIRLLTASATGQQISNYASFYSGPRRAEDQDGPAEYHVVLLDNGRSAMLGNEFRDMLRCFRCGACLNHCPVYGNIGGHAYGWVYPGPMGSVWTPIMTGLDESGDLPRACTLNGRCAEVCPMSIPLPDLLREHRRKHWQRGLPSRGERLATKLWAFTAQRPRLYRAGSALAVRLMALLGRRGRLRRLPLAGGWTGSRDLPAPATRTFMQAWQKTKGERG
ncbi:LutB/LldF family L-lactate oxidation iron-sulfur protein [Granulosicoccaceae sp. 1_MG-2023]|nr:LutB/LldF family L-lactate oxidation iron-sulfur protein [Granulosicoccaceae sp. 1_MG-2023]